jgi:hypothetical protein
MIFFRANRLQQFAERFDDRPLHSFAGDLMKRALRMIPHQNLAERTPCCPHIQISI